MTLVDTGDVGIGTNNPSAKLEIRKDFNAWNNLGWKTPLLKLSNQNTTFAEPDAYLLISTSRTVNSNNYGDPFI